MDPTMAVQTTQSPVAFIAISVLAMCFGWGMRGSAIGGEKGALLPGALIGILCAWYTGSDMMLENALIFGSAGAMGHAFGAMEPYASVMEMVLHRDSPRYNPPLGYLALAFKGAIWSGIGAAILGWSFSAMAGDVYKWYDIVIFCAQIPIAQEIGYRIFNTPYNVEKKLQPKVCFSSINSREEWGRNLILIAELLIMFVIRGDVFSILMWAGGAIGGSVGWMFAITFYDKEMHPLKNGKWLFGKMEKLKIVDGWKIMEFTQGCFQGLMIALAFILGWPLIADRYAVAEATGGLWYMLPQNVDTILSWVFCGLIIVSIFLFFIPYMRNGNKITQAFGEVDMNIVEVLERPCYMVFPLALVMLGSTLMANIMCGFVMYYVIAQHDGLERYWDFKNVTLVRIVIILIGAAVLAFQIFCGFTLWQAWAAMLIEYILFDLVYFYRPKRVAENWRNSKSFGQFLCAFRGDITVLPFFHIMLVALLVFGYVQFA